MSTTPGIVTQLLKSTLSAMTSAPNMTSSMTSSMSNMTTQLIYTTARMMTSSGVTRRARHNDNELNAMNLRAIIALAVCLVIAATIVTIVLCIRCRKWKAKPYETFEEGPAPSDDYLPGSSDRGASADKPDAAFDNFTYDD